MYYSATKPIVNNSDKQQYLIFFLLKRRRQKLQKNFCAGTRMIRVFFFEWRAFQDSVFDRCISSLAVCAIQCNKKGVTKKSA